MRKAARDSPVTAPAATVPWGKKSDIPRELIERAYERCKRGDPARCINTNLIRAFAEHQGREIRHTYTMNGKFSWSENIKGKWRRFEAPLREDYAAKIDSFDKSVSHFRGPVRCPMGPVRDLGPCVPMVPVTAEVTRERKARLNARIKSGELIPGERQRKFQLPFVKAAR